MHHCNYWNSTCQLLVKLIFSSYDNWEETCTVTLQQQGDLSSSLTPQLPNTSMQHKMQTSIFRKVFIRRSLYPLPAARTAVVHIVCSLHPFFQAHLHYAAKKHMVPSWHNNYIHFSLNPLFSLFFAVCRLVCNPTRNVFMLQVFVKNNLKKEFRGFRRGCMKGRTVSQNLAKC